MSDLPEYVIDRTFNAPRALVWRAWTDPDILHRWYGPNVETVIHRFDLEPGGAWFNEMKFGGQSHYSRMDFEEVTPLEKLVWRHASTDADWNVSPNAMAPDWPKVLLTTVTFEDLGAQTSVRLAQTPINASQSEIAAFVASMGNLDYGWGSGYDIIDGLLEELQAEGA